ncbi:hypothetical protein Caci_6511 [Catenulispora acidiphila DSM 44928]|uniref:Short-chain dehydrogenase/reductase SDR n=1 Tax=Catenulispora acidiphila (strain DSM 44928 / JCM 14897 / NBRC 102108 / NRRL B-24433 / ID139908) TaxID=479433 RepID=C7PY70_CATAD|nr:SDR family NAD(P)-dependent oxidoreductase [Catenulispora acidiphila]ACU75360.1 hypothetical protein Caci_6511 [Catenulispora acidiphila DSM 44928]
MPAQIAAPDGRLYVFDRMPHHARSAADPGVGRASARLFAKEGAKVVVAGRSHERGDELIAEINDSGGTAPFVEPDVEIAAPAGVVAGGVRDIVCVGRTLGTGLPSAVGSR